MDRNYLAKEYGHLQAGKTYVIAKSFHDYDSCPYGEGSQVEFIGSNFVPYEDGLSLFFMSKGCEKQIRLQVRPEAQQEIADNLTQYFVVVNE